MLGVYGNLRKDRRATKTLEPKVGAMRQWMRPSTFVVPLLLLPIMSWSVGCNGASSSTTSQAAPVAVKPPSLTLVCPDAAFAALLKERVGGWSGRSSTVRVVSDRLAAVPEADIVVLSTTDFAAAADAGEFSAMPEALRASDHFLQRNRIVESYRDTLTGWAGEVQGLPLRGDGFALVVRADRFDDAKSKAEYQRKFGRSLLPPRTWEDYTEIARFFAELDGGPCLPPLPVGSEEFLTLFAQIAACYDRAARKEGVVGGDASAGVSFFVDLNTGKPRLSSPGFRAAAERLAALAKYRRPNTEAESKDAVASLDAGAVMAVVDLGAVGRLPKSAETGAVQSRFAVYPMLGTETYLDAAGAVKKAGPDGNYVPYLGGTMRIGAVRKACPRPELAWAILAAAAAPAGSLALVGDPTVGSGPFRREHVDEVRTAVWLGYRFDEPGTRRLAAAMRSYPALDVLNPATAPRLPDMDVRRAAIEPKLRAAAEGKLPADVAVRDANAAWETIDAAIPAEVRERRLRQSTGAK